MFNLQKTALRSHKQKLSSNIFQHDHAEGYSVMSEPAEIRN